MSFVNLLTTGHLRILNLLIDIVNLPERQNLPERDRI